MRSNFQMIFQDPFASLNPRMKIGNAIAEGLIIHGEKHSIALTRAGELLDLVGLDRQSIHRFPHEFSGGQRQRIGIARALALNPKIIVSDEAVSALDVSVQKQVLKLLSDIKQEMGLSLLFITHDLRIAAQICDHVAVMRKGVVVECGTANQIFNNPQHPYTRSLLDAIPGRKVFDQQSL